jgi:hypothetical protein
MTPLIHCNIELLHRRYVSLETLGSLENFPLVFPTFSTFSTDYWTGYRHVTRPVPKRCSTLPKRKKSEVVPLRSIEAHVGDRRYSSSSFLTSALEGGEWSASRPGRALPLGEWTPGTHCIGGWVGPRAGLDAEVRGKILCLCRGSNPGRSVRSRTLYWLGYSIQKDADTSTHRLRVEPTIPMFERPKATAGYNWLAQWGGQLLYRRWNTWNGTRW